MTGAPAPIPFAMFVTPASLSTLSSIMTTPDFPVPAYAGGVHGHRRMHAGEQPGSTWVAARHLSRTMTCPAWAARIHGCGATGAEAKVIGCLI